MIPLAPLMSADELKAMLEAVKENSQIYWASGTPDILEQVFDLSKSAISETKPHWQSFVEEMTKKNHRSASSYYSYPELRTKLDLL
jgi:hypothetical protein